MRRAWTFALLLLAAPVARAQDNPDGGAPDAAPACPACPPCNVTVAPSPPPIPPPLPATQDPTKLQSGSAVLTIGDGSPPQPLLNGPFIITSLGSNCTARYYISGTEVYGTTDILFIPEGTTLEVGDAGGLCTGTVYWSGYRP